MTLVAKVKEAAAEVLAMRASDTKLRELSDFYQEKLRDGVALKRAYDLPPIDTVGKTAYKSK